MSGKKNRDRSALIVLSLLVGSIVLVSFLGLLSRHEVGRQARCYVEASAQGETAVGDPFCPDDHIFFGDGAAQWVMALFAIMATLVSAIALYWLRLTLKETERTAKAAIDANEFNRISSERQLRAYLGIYAIDCECAEIDKQIRVRVSFKNAGQTPGYRFQALGRVFVSGSVETHPVTFGLKRNVSQIDIPPDAAQHIILQSDKNLTAEAHGAIKSGASKIGIGGYGTYTDAFGKRRRIVFRSRIDFIDDEPHARSCPRNNRSN